MDKISQLIEMIKQLNEDCSKSNPNLKKELLEKAQVIQTKVEAMEDAFDSVADSIIKLLNEKWKKK